MALSPKPRPQSYLLHTGFLDLVDLVSHTTSKLRVHQASSRFLASGGIPATAAVQEVNEDSQDVATRHSDEAVAYTTAQPPVADVSGTAAAAIMTPAPDQASRRLSRVPVPPLQAISTRPVIGHAYAPRAARGRGNGQVALKYRKVNKRDISYPTHFRHVLHASTYEEAAELLMRWSIEGIANKMGDPAWAHPMKEIVQARVKEQQALAVAQVVEATAWSKTVGRISKQKLASGQLHVVNGLPSSIYSTTNNTLRSALPPPSSSLDRVQEHENTLAAEPGQGVQAGSGYFSPRTNVERPNGEEPSIAELLADAETPMLIANMPLGSSGEKLGQMMGKEKDVGGSKYALNPFMPTNAVQTMASSAVPEGTADDGPKDAGSTTDLAPTPPAQARPPAPLSTTAPAPLRMSPQKVPLGPRAQLKRRISPIQIKNKSLSPPPAESAEQAYMIKGSPPPDSPSSPGSPTFPPFRVIKPSLPTLERAMSIALYFEQYYHGLYRIAPSTNATLPSKAANHTPSKGVLERSDTSGIYLIDRAQRLAGLEEELAAAGPVVLSEEEKQERRRRWQREENRLLRERRQKVDVQAFDMGRVIGHGAFGVVRIAREKRTGDLVAIKQLRKADMLRKSQEGHIKAEKDVLAAAATRSFSPTGPDSGAPSWIVKLHYAFQDIDNLYLVLDFMGGGDLLNLLVALDTFSERMTRFYMAEMVLALAETHSLGYIHRDIKPDNFLFTPEGHVRVSDFGLATDLHWAHDTNHYQHQREALLKKHGVDLEYPAPSGTVRKKMRKKDVERIMGKEWLESGEGVLSWRDRNRRSMAYSVCGTNSYMAPEVIRGQGYGFGCDWWSLGVIMYECLYGYPPFTASSRHATRQKILHWKAHLKFPPSYQVSKQCVDFMTKLLCEPEDRLGGSARGSGEKQNGTIPRSASILGSLRGQQGAQQGLAGLGDDGVEEIKRHPWFAGIDWDTIHLEPASFNPALAAADDTKHFDTDIPDQPLTAPNGVPADATRDPMLGHSKHGKELLEIRKELAFKGWTFKSPTAGGDRRYGHMAYISSGGSSEGDDQGDAAGHRGGEGQENGTQAEGAEFGQMGLRMMHSGQGREVGTVLVRGGTMKGRALSL